MLDTCFVSTRPPNANLQSQPNTILTDRLERWLSGVLLIVIIFIRIMYLKRGIYESQRVASSDDERSIIYTIRPSAVL